MTVFEAARQVDRIQAAERAGGPGLGSGLSAEMQGTGADRHIGHGFHYPHARKTTNDHDSAR